MFHSGQRQKFLPSGTHLPSPMLQELRLCDFRPFPRLVFHPGPGANFLIGANAQGKTSVLEAACLLLRLQSPRTTSPAECVRFGNKAFSIDGRWAGRHLHLKYEGRLKHFALDSKVQSTAADYLSVGKVVWISNADLELVRGTGSSRRRFLDFLGVQLIPGYLGQLRSYERSLRSRNNLLREARPRREIAAFDVPLISSGDFLLQARGELCAILGPLVGDFHRQISGAGESPGMVYRPGAREAMAVALEASLPQEERLRTTTVGPHRDDVELLLDERPAEAFGSEGQQRSLALALKLAQARAIREGTGISPLYLIDDVFGELDTSRRNNLLGVLPVEAQKLFTTTTLSWLRESPTDALVFQLEAGVIKPV